MPRKSRGFLRIRYPFAKKKSNQLIMLDLFHGFFPSLVNIDW